MSTIDQKTHYLNAIKDAENQLSLAKINLDEVCRAYRDFLERRQLSITLMLASDDLTPLCYCGFPDGGVRLPDFMITLEKHLFKTTFTARQEFVDSTVTNLRAQGVYTNLIGKIETAISQAKDVRAREIAKTFQHVI